MFHNLGTFFNSANRQYRYYESMRERQREFISEGVNIEQFHFIRFSNKNIADFQAKKFEKKNQIHISKNFDDIIFTPKIT